MSIGNIGTAIGYNSAPSVLCSMIDPNDGGFYSNNCIGRGFNSVSLSCLCNLSNLPCYCGRPIQDGVLVPDLTSIGTGGFNDKSGVCVSLIRYTQGNLVRETVYTCMCRTGNRCMYHQSIERETNETIEKLKAEVENLTKENVMLKTKVSSSEEKIKSTTLLEKHQAIEDDFSDLVEVIEEFEDAVADI